MLPGGWIEGLSNSTNTFNNSKMTVDSSMDNASESISPTFVLSRLDIKRPKNVLGLF